MTPPLLTTAEFADLHNIRESTVRAYCSRGKITGARYDHRARRWMIPQHARITTLPRGRPKGKR